MVIDSLSRDEVCSLVGVKFTTLAVWRHKGFVSEPSEAGGSAKQSRYSPEKVFEIYCFALASERLDITLSEASTISRYVSSRPGLLEPLLHYWDRPVRLLIHPKFDLTAFDAPKRLLLDLVVRSSEVIRKKYDSLKNLDGTYKVHASQAPSIVNEALPVDALFSHIRDFLDKRQVEIEEGQSEEGLREPNTRGALAGRIFRNAKWLQYGGLARRSRYADWLDALDLSKMTVEQHLAAEAWALQYLQDVLDYNGLSGPPGWSDSYPVSLDVTSALENVAAAFQLPKTQRRSLRIHEPKIARFL